MTANNNRDERTPDMTEEGGAVERLRKYGTEVAFYGETGISADIDLVLSALSNAERERGDMEYALASDEFSEREQAARATSAEAEAASWKADAASEFLKRQEVEARLAEAVAALKPFVHATESMKPTWDDETKVMIEMPTTRRSGRPVAWVYASDVYRARDLVSRQEGASQ